MTRRIVNLTPHYVNVYDKKLRLIKSFPSEGVARAGHITDLIKIIDGVEVIQRRSTYLVNLPDPVPDTAYIVSSITAIAARYLGRRTDDLLITTGLVRDRSNKKVIGCKQLILVGNKEFWLPS